MNLYKIAGRMRSAMITASGLLLACAVTLAAGQTPVQPKAENAKVEQRSVSGSLSQTVAGWTKAADHAQWLAYSVPAVSGDRQVCCGNNWGNGNCGPCRLEGSEYGNSINLRSDKVELEGPRRIIVLLRAENHKVGKIRVVSEDCTLDAGGLQIFWLPQVNPAESVQVLQTLMDANEFEGHGDRLSRGALTAIALHADPSADQAIANFTSPSKPEGMRKEAAFWAGEARGANGLVLLKRMAKDDPSSEVRAQVTFALSVSREPTAVDEMIRMAHDDSSTHVRGQALFWLAQKAGKKAST